MYRFVLRPRWLIGHVVVAGLVVLMVNLGFWQLRRLEGRREINSSLRARESAPTAPITALATGGDESSIEFRSTSATGTFDAAHQFAVRTSGQSVDIVTPLVLADGRAVLVDRGAVEAVDALKAAPAPPAGTIEVTGRVRRSAADRGFADPGELDHVDVNRIASALAYPLLPVYIELVTPVTSGRGQPEPVLPPQLDDGPHLSYAVQWFLFSACALAGWPLLIRASARKHRRNERATQVPAGAGTDPAEAEPLTQR